jgi:hypothetical protein
MNTQGSDSSETARKLRLTTKQITLASKNAALQKLKIKPRHKHSKGTLTPPDEISPEQERTQSTPVRKAISEPQLNLGLAESGHFQKENKLSPIQDLNSPETSGKSIIEHRILLNSPSRGNYQAILLPLDLQLKATPTRVLLSDNSPLRGIDQSISLSTTPSRARISQNSPSRRSDQTKSLPINPQQGSTPARVHKQTKRLSASTKTLNTSESTEERDDLSYRTLSSDAIHKLTPSKVVRFATEDTGVKTTGFTGSFTSKGNSFPGTTASLIKSVSTPPKLIQLAKNTALVSSPKDQLVAAQSPEVDVSLFTSILGKVVTGYTIFRGELNDSLQQLQKARKKEPGTADSFDESLPDTQNVSDNIELREIISKENLHIDKPIENNSSVITGTIQIDNSKQDISGDIVNLHKENPGEDIVKEVTGSLQVNHPVKDIAKGVTENPQVDNPKKDIAKDTVENLQLDDLNKNLHTSVAVGTQEENPRKETEKGETQSLQVNHPTKDIAESVIRNPLVDNPKKDIAKHTAGNPQVDDFNKNLHSGVTVGTQKENSRKDTEKGETQLQVNHPTRDIAKSVIGNPSVDNLNKDIFESESRRSQKGDSTENTAAGSLQGDNFKKDIAKSVTVNSRVYGFKQDIPKKTIGITQKDSQQRDISKGAIEKTQKAFTSVNTTSHLKKDNPESVIRILDKDESKKEPSKSVSGNPLKDDIKEKERLKRLLDIIKDKELKEKEALERKLQKLQRSNPTTTDDYQSKNTKSAEDTNPLHRTHLAWTETVIHPDNKVKEDSQGEGFLKNLQKYFFGDDNSGVHSGNTSSKHDIDSLTDIGNKSPIYIGSLSPIQTGNTSPTQVLNPSPVQGGYISSDSDSPSSSDEEDMGEPPQYFHGRHLEDARQHVKMIQLWLTTRKPPPIPAADAVTGLVPRYNERDQALMSFFASTLKDAAFTWFNTLILGPAVENIGTVNQLITEFELRFRFDETSKWRELGRLNQKRQRPDQSTEDYITEVQNTGRQIRATESEIETTVMNGLRPELQDAVLIHDLDQDHKLQQIRKWASIAERSSKSQFNPTVQVDYNALQTKIDNLAQKFDQVQLRPIMESAKAVQFEGATAQNPRRERSASPYPRLNAPEVTDRQPRGNPPQSNANNPRSLSQPARDIQPRESENQLEYRQQQQQQQLEYGPTYQRGPPRRGMQPTRGFYGGPRPLRNPQPYVPRQQYSPRSNPEGNVRGSFPNPGETSYQTPSFQSPGSYQQPYTNPYQSDQQSYQTNQQPYQTNQQSYQTNPQSYQTNQQQNPNPYRNNRPRSANVTRSANTGFQRNQTGGCTHCANTVQCAPGSCWAQGRECYRCHKFNHIASKCQAKMDGQ